MIPVLIKLRLTAFVTLSSLFGFLFFKKWLEMESIYLVISIFSVAAGAALLNNLQDYKIDKDTPRTSARSVFLNRITLKKSRIIAFLLIIGGIFFLTFSSMNFTASVLTVIAVVLYNGVYTPLKTRTLFSLVPGAVSGALPPVIGYVLGGGNITDKETIFLFLIFIFWQFPHSLLIWLSDKESSGKISFPAFIRKFSEIQLRRIILIWLSGFLALISLVPIFCKIKYLLFSYFFLFGNISLLFIFLICIFFNFPNIMKYKKLFSILNLFIFLFLISLLSDRILYQ